ncbi:retropepsin-like aspartic protease [Butyricimonas paravirosa]|uniref:retropepsin-like aspartic protease n=1 Tax=Butyricimonas paravirosa TaxID=1472417 RepID=UPI00210B46AB|nr:retropepsin-like aspartic protease [Butyricimonas paravirosa]MCQ4873300.1 retroviral-like aspartic protease family protein [Butyricimonas paravirosa]
MLSMRVVCWLLLSLLAVPVAAQQVKSVTPYRVVGGKMIVDMSVNGQMRSFIFDTGGQMALTGELCEELGIAVTDSVTVTDANGKGVSFPKVVVTSLLLPDGRIHFSDVPAMKLSTPSPFECFHADGLIGSDLFKDLMVEIDSKAKTITVSSAEKASTISLRCMIPFSRNGYMPIITLQAGTGNNLVVLFDTGSPGFMSLKDSDYDNLYSGGACQTVSEGFGEGSISVGGMAGMAGSYRARFPVVSVGGTKFRNVISETSTPPYTLLGMKLLEYGKVTIDYPRKRLYFEPYEAEADLTSKHYNVNLRVKDGDLVVATVWSAMKGVVEVGDKVVRINGKPAGKYDFCESIITGIPELKAKKKTKLTIRTKQGEKVIVYQKE